MIHYHPGDRLTLATDVSEVLLWNSLSSPGTKNIYGENNLDRTLYMY